MRPHSHTVLDGSRVGGEVCGSRFSGGSCCGAFTCVSLLAGGSAKPLHRAEGAEGLAGDTAGTLAGKGGKERVCLGQMWAVWVRKLAVPLKSCQRALGAGRGLQLRQTQGQTDFWGSGLWGIRVAEGTVLHPVTGRGPVRAFGVLSHRALLRSV